MKRLDWFALLFAALAMIATSANVAHADTIVVQLGTPVAAANGTQLSIGQWNAAVAGAVPAVPFVGFDNAAGPSFSKSFLFNFVVPVGQTIASASVTLGIYDHDSAADGDQVNLFMLDTADLTSNLNALFNASGGSSVFTPNPAGGPPLQLTSEYNVYTLGLSSLSDLADGSLGGTLTLKNGFAFPLGVPTLTAHNSAAVDFMRLTVETRDSGTAPVPEPASLTLLLVGLGAAAACSRMRKFSKRATE